MTSPARAPRLHVPSALNMPGAVSVLTPFGAGDWAKPGLAAITATADRPARTRRYAMIAPSGGGARGAPATAADDWHNGHNSAPWGLLRRYEFRHVPGPETPDTKADDDAKSVADLRARHPGSRARRRANRYPGRAAARRDADRR